MLEKVWRIRMFGGLSMYYGDEAVTLNKIGNSKSVRLLQMLLLSLQGGISKNELMDNLYGWNEKTDAANRNKNLNNLLYRLKGQLISCGLPDVEYVELNEGMCFFKNSIPIELDTRQFEETVKQARFLPGGGGKKVSLLWQANEIYCGELLPTNQTDTWFVQKANYFKSLYVEMIEGLENELIKLNDYKSRLFLYSRAAAIYPFDNWQTKQIRCNLEVYRYDEALDIYNRTMELYAREMGSPPTSEMQECFENLELKDGNHGRINEGNRWKEMDKVFMGRKNDIKQAIFGNDKTDGAYYCTYPSFVDYCRLVARAKGRSKFEAVLMFLTLSQRGKKGGQKQMDLQEQMQLLKKVIGDSLRTGDAFTRYGNRHFILMLVKIEKDFCSSVFRRIETAYVKKAGKGHLWYYADMTQELEESIL